MRVDCLGAVLELSAEERSPLKSSRLPKAKPALRAVFGWFLSRVLLPDPAEDQGMQRPRETPRRLVDLRPSPPQPPDAPHRRRRLRGRPPSGLAAGPPGACYFAGARPEAAVRLTRGSPPKIELRGDHPRLNSGRGGTYQLSARMRRESTADNVLVDFDGGKGLGADFADIHLVAASTGT